MILRRLLQMLVWAATLSAAGAVIVFALAFALYAVAEPRVGRAWAAAIVAGAAAGSILLAGVLLALTGRARADRAAPLAEGLFERAFAFVTEKPILTAAAAIGMGLMSVRNPKYLGAVLRAFFEGAPPRA
jgi:hypothetical protein